MEAPSDAPLFGFQVGGEQLSPDACADLHLGFLTSPLPPYGEKWQTKTIVK